MTQRIFRSILLVAFSVLLACLVIILGVLYEYFTALQDSQIEAQTELAARGVESGGAAYLGSLEVKSFRITWISPDGTVLYDSQAAPETMENHADREEIREALSDGTGKSTRYSATLEERTTYLARKLPDGTVIRVSATQVTALSLALGMLWPILIVLAAAVILSAVLAGGLSKRIVKPLNELNLDRPLENDAYEELSPLLTRIDRQHRQISAQMDALKRRQDEFEAVTVSMNEGLVLLNEKGRVLSMNPAACRIFDADGCSVGEDFLTVDRSREITGAIDAAMSGGHSEVHIARSGREYQLDASGIGQGTQAAGVVLLIFDVTEKTFAERNRREFTANVSHELKTPLQSILGSAELIENGLVKPEDMPRFLSHIRREAAHLVALIEDILRLSQLDEGGELPREEIDLYALAAETAKSLAGAAGAKNVTIAVHGRGRPVNGVRRLMQEIVFNLCDNAIKYNRDGGRVDISISETDGGAVLTVEDTGAGIPAELHDRVFERFYRVEKSHSRETGGTGLGLSIVKHAAQVLGAGIQLESRPGQGTRVRIRFPNSPDALL